MALLSRGDFVPGWDEYDWRWRGGLAGLTPPDCPKPRWTGNDIKGRTIWLYGEQGLGDVLQFARFATVIAEQGARVILEVQAPLKRLAATIPGVAKVIAAGEALPDFDCHLPLMSAPLVLRTTEDSIPSQVPYVRPDPEQATLWAKRLADLPGLKVGLVWSGNPRPHDPGAHLVDRRRSIPLADLTPLLSVPGVSFISLQKDGASAQLETIALDIRPHDWMDEIGDFADTAALVANLDLVIAVDTSVVHLAGALGKPVWILSRFDGCWRWLADREDSPWYPTARLFRQKSPGDWTEVVTRLVSALILRTEQAAKEDCTNLPPAQLFAQAVKHHQAGRLAEATALYELILKAEPHNAGCLFHLGLIAQQRGRHDEAITLFTRAAARNNPGLHDALGTSYSALGRIPEAIVAHRRALAIKPDFFEACYNLGNAYQNLGDISRATACFRQTLVQRPDLAEPYNNLGNLLASEKKSDEAAIAFRRAMILHPDFAAAHNNLGNVLKEGFHFGEAAICFEQALRIQADYVEAHYNLGNTLLEAARLDDAILAFRRAVTIRPDLTEAYNNLGAALHMQGSPDQAILCYDRSLVLDPSFPEAHSNLGTVFRDRGNFEKAEASYRKAIVGNPDYALAHSNLAVTLLLQGHYAEGLPEFEWRRQRGPSQTKPRPDLPPRWRGENPAGRTLLLQAEQGLGDVLQFARYASVIAEQGGRVILDVYPPLQRLLASLPGVAAVLTPNDPLPPDIDWHLPMMSAPLVMGTRLETIPADIPYLTADATSRDVWRHRLAGLSGLKVGLVWAGDPRLRDPYAHAVDRRRSMALAQLTPLLALPGVRFVSLQKGDAAAQIADLPADLRPFDPMDAITDFADTAAVIANLDLVISVDTAVVHLAGALGKPVWILSRLDACWRWLADRDDSPWYPTARLFRQTTPGEWRTVIETVAKDLTRLVEKNGTKG
jgi:tetratricopeptide (TPR) repeat protein